MDLKSDINESDIFEMGRGAFASRMLSLYGKPWIIALAIISIPLLAAAFFADIRWGILLLMVVFLLTPMLLFFLYFFYGLLPVCVMNVMPHKLKFKPEGIESEIFQKKTDEESGEETVELLSSMTIPYTSLNTYIAGLSSVAFPLHGGRKGFIWIPVSAFSDDDSFKKAIETIISATRSHPDNLNTHK